MAMVINSNIASLTAQRALGESQKMQQTAMERLSTGQRINSAADDAAGMAIAEGFTSQIRGLSQAVRNANEALSLAQTAESGLQETTDILQRIRELAVQASNTTLTSSDRTAIQNEVSALTTEIDRIATTTQYNSSNILDGSATALSFQVGDKSDQSISLSIDSATASDLGLSGAGAGASGGLVVGGKVDASVNAADLIEHDDVLINGQNWGASDAALTGRTEVDPITGANVTRAYTQQTAYGVAQIINSNTGAHGVEATAMTTISGDAGSGVTTGGGTVALTGFAAQTFTLGATNNMQELADAINQVDEHITATLNARGGIDYSDALGRTVTFGGDLTTGTSGFAALANTGHVSLSSVDGKSDIVISGPDIEDAVAPNANTFSNHANAAGDIGERVTAANLLGFNFGTYSYSGGTSITTGQLGRTLLAGTDTLTVNGVKLGTTPATVTLSQNVVAQDIAAAFNAVSDQSGVTALAKNQVTMQMNMNTESDVLSTDTHFLTINGVASTTGTNIAIDTLISDLNSDHLAAATGLTFTKKGNSSIVVESSGGANISIQDAATTQIVDVIHADGDRLNENGAAVAPGGNATYLFRGFLELSNTSGDIVIGTTATNDDAYTTAETLAASLGLELSKKSDASSSGGLNLSSATNASAALAAIDTAINAVNTIRGGLGAVSNRLDYTVSNLTKTVENHSASRSRIVDADFATESAALSKAQVLAQASTAMLAQANAAPQLALQLLQ